jgi:hypothetical protein
MTLAQIKERLIDAHRRKDWDRAKELSQLKQSAKKQEDNNRRCVVCGVRLSHGGKLRCPMHYRLHRFYGHRLAASFLLLFCLGMATQPPLDADISWAYKGAKPESFTIIIADSTHTNRVVIGGSYHGTTVGGFYAGKKYTVTVLATLQGVEGRQSEPATVLVPYYSPKYESQL